MNSARILCTFPGGTGHFLPIVPVARAAEAAGHTVAFACQPAMVAVVEATGLTAFATGGDSLLAAGVRQPLVAPEQERKDRGADRDRERADAVLALCRDWRPDVLVCDESDFGPVVAAERLGIPHACVQSTATASVTASAANVALANDLRARHGLPPDPGFGMLHRYLALVPFPRSLRDPGCPLPSTAGLFRDVEPGPAVRSDPPLVYVTLGTIFNQESGDLFERIVEGVRGLPVSVVATVGRELDPAVLGPQPANVHIGQYVPQARFLPSCALVVSHGGSGSVLGALAHGVPMVVVPIGADQPRNARRCADLGVARVVPAQEASPGRVRTAAAEVMADGMYRRNAARIRDEILALPGPDHAVALLEDLTR